MSKRRILIIENSIAVTGALKSVIRSSEALSNFYTFVFLLPENSTALKYVRDLGFETLEMPMKELRKSILSVVTYLPRLLYNAIKLFGIARKLKIDLILVNDFYNLLACRVQPSWRKTALHLLRSVSSI